MFHSLVLAVFLLAALALAVGFLGALFGTRRLARSGDLFRHAVQHTFEQYVGGRYGTDVMFGTTNSPSAAQGGWSLIDRNLRAKRAVRFAVR
jgi:hypothetical protein